MSDSELYRAALEIHILTAIVAKAARQDIEQRLKSFGVELTALQYRVLRQLEQRRSTIKALSQTLMVEPATLVPVIDTLARQGFVRRTRDLHDRRRIPLEVTEVGREHLSRIPFAHEDDVIVTYLRQLPAHERDLFLERLRGLVAAIHGHDEAVRGITDAVKAHFAFGEHQRQMRQPQALATDQLSQPVQEESSS